MPEMHSVELKDARRALIHRFPYSIFYRYADGTVMIQAVFHNARDPRKWQARLT
jgi:plasmid stabilization system protein ParE